MTQVTTIGAYEALPIGTTTPGGSRGRAVAFKPWMLDDDLELGRILEEYPNLSAAEYASHVLAHFLTTFGHHEMQEAKIGERLLILGQASQADVMTAWVLLRRHAMGNDVDVDLECGNCHREFIYVVDAGSIELTVLNDDEPLSRTLRISETLRFRGQDVRDVILGPTKWRGYCATAKDRGNIMAIRAGLVVGSIEGFADSTKPGAPAEAELRSQMTKRTLETLAADVESHRLGPSFEIETKCPDCRKKVGGVVPWPYASFFSRRASSREEASKPPAISSPTSSTEAREDSPST